MNDGTTQKVNVREYREYDPQDEMPETVKILVGNSVYNTIELPKDIFLQMLVACAKGGRIVAAVKMLRQAAPTMGLKEAKELIESLLDKPSVV